MDAVSGRDRLFPVHLQCLDAVVREADWVRDLG
jgi:hypothetical protein